jgi:FkbM family methyltransferase
MAEGWRRPVLRASRRLGVESSLRWAQRTLASPMQRRDLKDIEHMRLLMRLSLAHDANCIDIGANVGDVLREILAAAPAGRHVAYEPLPDLAAGLARSFPAVDVRNAAVADVPGEATFYRVRSAPTRSSLAVGELDRQDLEPLQVRVDALDDALERDYAPALIKIDVEGAEREVLAGARRILAEHRPTVVFEHGSSAGGFGGEPTRDIHSLLSASGHRIFDIDGAGPLSASEFEAVTKAGKVWTFVAHA